MGAEKVKHMKQIKTAFAAVSAAFIVIGLCLLIWPGISAAAICTVVGIISIACGLIRFIGYFSNDLYSLAFQFDLSVGIMAIVVGCALIAHPSYVLISLPVVIGIFCLMDSILRLQTAIDAKHFGMKKWWVIMMLSVGGAVLGALLLFQPFEGGQALMRLMGVALIFDGVENLMTDLYTVKVPRRACADANVIEAEYTVFDDN